MIDSKVICTLSKNAGNSAAAYIDIYICSCVSPSVSPRQILACTIDQLMYNTILESVKRKIFLDDLINLLVGTVGRNVKIIVFTCEKRS
jgi:hypothetical protein